MALLILWAPAVEINNSELEIVPILPLVINLRPCGMGGGLIWNIAPPNGGASGCIVFKSLFRYIRGGVYGVTII